MKKVNFALTALGAVLIVVAGCNTATKSNQENKAKVAAQQIVYEAHLQPLNSKVTGLQTTGDARFVVANDTMTVTINVKNAPPNMEHWQHFHGFANDSMAVNATAADDKNGDGIVDVVESAASSGATMVPFNKFPAKMDVGANTYPIAGKDGSYHYEAKIPMDSLKAAFAKAFNGSAIDLDKRVLYIHGVPTGTKLPKSVASIGSIPAQVTLPIACGEIRKVSE